MPPPKTWVIHSRPVIVPPQRTSGNEILLELFAVIKVLIFACRCNLKAQSERIVALALGYLVAVVGVGLKLHTGIAQVIFQVVKVGVASRLSTVAYAHHAFVVQHIREVGIVVHHDPCIILRAGVGARLQGGLIGHYVYFISLLPEINCKTYCHNG